MDLWQNYSQAGEIIIFFLIVNIFVNTGRFSIQIAKVAGNYIYMHADI